MENFLPKNYKPKNYKPKSPSRYMGLRKGDNILRILSAPIIGNEYWVSVGDGSRKPIRKQRGETIYVADLEEGAKIKEFWAMVVWNYAENAIQILKITQASIYKTLYELNINKAWGDPRQYDIVIKRQGEGMLTRYDVMPQPIKDIDIKILDQYGDMYINLEALYDGLNPFEEVRGQIDTEEIERALEEEEGGKHE